VEIGTHQVVGRYLGGRVGAVGCTKAVISVNAGASGPSESCTSSVETCGKRQTDASLCQLLRAASSRVKVPSTLVLIKASGPVMEPSTCDSAAKLTRVSMFSSSNSRLTRSAPQMLPCTKR